MVPSPESCAGCSRPAKKLYPFCPHDPNRDPRYAMPLFCDRCIREEWARRRHLAEKMTAESWAREQYADMEARAYFARSFYEAHRGMIRTEPFPPQGRCPSFVWDMKPGRTLVTEYAQAPRYVKTNWS